jgi:hypothetical protein
VGLNQVGPWPQSGFNGRWKIVRVFAKESGSNNRKIEHKSGTINLHNEYTQIGANIIEGFGPIIFQVWW